MSYLAKVTMDGLSEQELVYVRKELYDYNDITFAKRIVQLNKNGVVFAEIVDDLDYKTGSLDFYMRHLAHEIVCRYRTVMAVEKSPEAPFTRTCNFLILSDASEPIRYTIEYTDYDRDYLTDEIIEKPKEDD